MDSLPAAILIGFVVLLGAFFTNCTVGLLAYKTGRWIEKKNSETTMLRAQLEELKTLITQADYAALLAAREIHANQTETARAQAILDAAKSDQ